MTRTRSQRSRKRGTVGLRVVSSVSVSEKGALVSTAGREDHYELEFPWLPMWRSSDTLQERIREGERGSPTWNGSITFDFTTDSIRLIVMLILLLLSSSISLNFNIMPWNSILIPTLRNDFSVLQILRSFIRQRKYNVILLSIPFYFLNKYCNFKFSINVLDDGFLMHAQKIYSSIYNIKFNDSAFRRTLFSLKHFYNVSLSGQDKKLRSLEFLARRKRIVDIEIKSFFPF